VYWGVVGMGSAEKIRRFYNEDSGDVSTFIMARVRPDSSMECTPWCIRLAT